MRSPRMVCAAIGLALALASAGPPPLAAQGARASLPGPPPLGLDVYLPVPDDNPLTAEGVELGRRLFLDPVLSADGRVACASCHRPERAFADTVAVSPGVFGRRGRRNTPSLANAGYGRAFFWDGRTTSLEEQVLRPIGDPDEMGSGLADVVARLGASPDYRAAFRRAFGEEVSASGVARALASYVRTLRSGGSPLDRYRSGERAALSGLAEAGYRLFIGRAACATCHLGPTLTDQRFHNTGVAWRTSPPLDEGRFQVSGNSADLGAFKTPALRNVALTAPYMHDASLPTLETVVDFYDRGGRANPWLDSDVRPLGLSAAEKEALLAFLLSLTGEP